MAKERILVVDDEPLVRWSLREGLDKAGFQVSLAESGEEALRILGEESQDLVLLDNRLPGSQGVEVLGPMKELDPDMVVIMITAHADVKTAVEAMKLGAFDYFTKPFEIEEIVVAVQKALETTRLKREVTHLLKEQEERWGFGKVIARSPAMIQVIETAQKVAASETTTVLLEGETGTGKDLIARAIHFASSRGREPFVPISCSALPENLLESELFGYEKGAFTDAKVSKKGLFETGNRGTVYLDEIGDVRPSLGIKLLRVIEEKTFRRVGGTKDIQVDVRIIAATNRDLEKLVKEGAFREDLYFRLKVVPIMIPPLRERREEILPLANFFIEAFCREYRRKPKTISPGAESAMLEYDWPGNVRELRNVIERAVILEPGDELLPTHLPFDIIRPKLKEAERVQGLAIPPEGISLEKVEEELIKAALVMTQGNQSEAARLLDLSRDTLRYRARKLGLK
jgi:two-component system response regulator AtoC